MKDEHPWHGMLKKYILRASVAVSLCGILYAVCEKYQTEEPFYPDLYVRNSRLQGNSIVFPDERLSGANQEQGNSELWEQEAEAEEKRMPEHEWDSTQLMKVSESDSGEAAASDGASEQESPAVDLQQFPSEQIAAAISEAIPFVMPENVEYPAAGYVSVSLDAPVSGTAVGGGGTDDSDDDRTHNAQKPSTGTSKPADPAKPAEPVNPVEPVAPVEPNKPEQPEEPEEGERKELPVNPEDEEQGIVPFPREGISDDGGEHEYRLSFQNLNEDAREQLYYSQELDDWELLCAVYAYVEEDGVRKYRLDGYGDCFQVENYPETASEDFDATFAFRPNPEETWQESVWNYSVQPYKVVLEDWDGEELDCLFPQEDEAVNLLAYNGDMIPYTVGEEQASIFPGWSVDQDSDETVGNFYTAEEKGMKVLKPVSMEEVPDGMTVQLQTAQVEEASCYVQALTACDAYENGAEGILEVPDGICRIASEEEAGIRAMTMSVTEKVMDIASGPGIAVDGAYEVDSRNENYSSEDGVLFDQEQTFLYQVPLQKESVTVPETVKEISDYGISNVSEIRFQSEEPPKFNAAALKENVKIYVPEEQYFSYLSVLEGDQYTLFTQDGETIDYIRSGGAILSTDGCILFGVENSVTEIFVVPDGVRQIQRDALKQVGEIHFQSEQPPEVEPGAFGTNPLPDIFVPAGASDRYRAAWETVLGDVYEELVILEEKEIDETICMGEDGVEYHRIEDSETGEVILWKAPEDLEQYTPDSIPDGLIVTEIADEAFAGCQKLDLVILPDTVEQIGERVFADSALRELHLSDSLKMIHRDLLEGTSLEILNLEGDELLELDYGQQGNAFTFGCEDFRIMLNGEEPEEGDFLTDEYLELWRLQILGYESENDLFWDVYREEFWHGGFWNWDLVRRRVEEILQDGECQVRQLFGLDERDSETWMILQELEDEEILDEEILDEESEIIIPESDQTEVSEEIREEASEEIPEEISEETPEEIMEEIPEEVPEKITEETPKEVPEEISEKISEEVSEECFGENEQEEESGQQLPDSPVAAAPEKEQPEKQEEAADDSGTIRAHHSGSQQSVRWKK